MTNEKEPLSPQELQREQRTTRNGIWLSMLVGLAVLLLIGVVVLSWSTREDGSTRGATPPNDAAGSTPSSKTLDSRSEPPVGARSTGPSSSPSTSERAPAHSTIGQPSMEVSFGQLIIMDVDGRELNHENGEIELRAPADAGEKVIAIPFENGSFSLAGLRTGQYRVEGAKGGAKADPRQVAFKDPQFVYSPDVRLILRGTYLRDSVLYVVDAGTGVPLGSVSVLVKKQHHAGAEQNHPGPHGQSDFCVRNKPSPVRLPRVRGMRSYWVTANGYAWGFIQVDHETGGERELRLERGGSLKVQVVGNDTIIETYFRLRSRDSRQVVTTFLLNESGGWQGLGGIAPGEYDARVEVGPADGEVVLLGETQTIVGAGETSTVRIELHGDPIPALVPVGGVLVLPPAHRELRPSLRIRPADGPAFRRGDVKRVGWDAMATHENTPGVLSWNADHLTPGRYLFVVEPFEYGILIDVPQAPLENVRIEVPSLHPVVVCAVDANTRKPIVGMKLRWSREGPVQQSGAKESIEIEAEPGQGCVSLLVPAGAISLSVRGPTHGEQSMNAYIGTTSRHFTVELPARFPRDIVLFDGDTSIPWMQGMTCTLRNVLSTVPNPCERVGEAGMRAYFETPGEYELVVGPIPGFQQPAPMEVSINQETDLPIVIQLSR